MRDAFHHVKFFFQFWQLIGFLVGGQLCCSCQGEESLTFFSGNILYTLLKVVFHQKSSYVKDPFPLKVVFGQRSSSIKGRLPSKVVFRQRSSSFKGCVLPPSCPRATPEVNQAKWAWSFWRRKPQEKRPEIHLQTPKQKNTVKRNMSSAMCLPAMGKSSLFLRLSSLSSSIEGRLPSNVVFHQRSSSI